MAKWTNVELTASSEAGTGSWVDVSRLRNITAAISNSTAASVPSCTVILQATNDILGSVTGAGREPFTRLASVLMSATADMTTLVISTPAGDNRTDICSWKYMRLKFSTWSAGSAKIVLRGQIDEEDSI
jgi:hypothetical protein